MTNRGVRVGIVQRVVPGYRAPFFNLLGQTLPGELCVFAGLVPRSEAIQGINNLEHARLTPARNWHLLNAGSSFYLLWQSNLLKWLRDYDPHVLIVEANPRYLSTYQAMSWMHARRRPVIGWGLGAPWISKTESGSGRVLARGFDGWRRRFLLQMDALIAYSHRGAREYQRLGFPVERIFVAVNAVTPRPVSPPFKAEVRDDGRVVLLFVGRLQTRKRLDVLLRACAAIEESLQPEVWIVGDGPARGEIENLARVIYPQAKFLGAVYGEELERCFARADLFVLPGTGGLAVQQAMAHGLPVIVAEGDGTQDDLVLPGCGWQVPAGDVAALARVLGEALSDPARLRSMGQAAYQVVEKVANIEEMVRAFIQAIEAVLPRVNGGAR